MSRGSSSRDQDVFANWNAFAQANNIDTITDVEPLISAPRPRRRVNDEEEAFIISPLQRGDTQFMVRNNGNPRPDGSMSSGGLGLSNPLPIFAGLMVALLIALVLYLGISPKRRKQAVVAAAAAAASANANNARRLGITPGTAAASARPSQLVKGGTVRPVTEEEKQEEAESNDEQPAVVEDVEVMAVDDQKEEPCAATTVAAEEEEEEQQKEESSTAADDEAKPVLSILPVSHDEALEDNDDWCAEQLQSYLQSVS